MSYNLKDNLYFRAQYGELSFERFSFTEPGQFSFTFSAPLLIVKLQGH